jgi:transcription elongation factor GreA
VAQKEMILTPEGLARLEEELAVLRTVKRQEIAERIKSAISFGDLSENAEYDEAKKEQAFIEGRIATIERMLKNARLIDEQDYDPERVGMGSKVTLLDMEFNEEITYTIVSSAEASPRENKISDQSPVGCSLLGRKVGDTVDVAVPAGVIRYKIVRLER